MSEGQEKYNRALDGAEAVIGMVKDDQWEAQSPCESWKANDVVGHLVGGLKMVSSLATTGETGGERSPDLRALAGDDPKAIVRTAERKAMSADLTPENLDEDGQQPVRCDAARSVPRRHHARCDHAHVGPEQGDRSRRHARSRSRAPSASRHVKPLDAMLRQPNLFEPKVEPPAGRRRADAAHGVPGRTSEGAGLTTPIPFVRDLEVEYGRVDQVSPLIRRVVAENPSKFTYLGTGTYIVGRGEVAVDRSGSRHRARTSTRSSTRSNPASASRRSSSRTRTPTTRRRHRALAERTDAPDVGLRSARRGARRRSRRPHRVRRRGGRPLRTLRRTATSCARRPTRRSSRTARIGHGDVIDGKGWTLEAIHTPGHTSNHLCYALREENAVFTGDHVMGWSTSVIGPPDGELGAVPRQPPPAARSRRRHLLADARAAGHRAARRSCGRSSPTEPSAPSRSCGGCAAGPATIAELVPEMYADVGQGPVAAGGGVDLRPPADAGRRGPGRRPTGRPGARARTSSFESPDLV